MPYDNAWTPNELFFEYQGVRIFHVYKRGEGPAYALRYSTASDSIEDDDTTFNVDDLPTWVPPQRPPHIEETDSEEQKAMKSAAIDSYWLEITELRSVRAAISDAIDQGYLVDYIIAAIGRQKIVEEPWDPRMPQICANCRFWRQKASIPEGWGSCDNRNNKIMLAGTKSFSQKIADRQTREELLLELKRAIRYPHDFGCRFCEK